MASDDIRSDLARHVDNDDTRQTLINHGTALPALAPAASSESVPALTNQTPDTQYLASSGPQRANRVPTLIGAAIGLVLLLGALAGYLALGGGRDEVNLAAQPVTNGQSAPHESSTAPMPRERASAWPPAGGRLCPGSNSVAVNSVTSCEFAVNVTEAFESTGEGDVEAYSPVTEQHYTMTCSALQTGVVLCTGGNQAQVWIKD